MLTAALFIIIKKKKKKQPKCPSTAEWMKKLIYSYNGTLLNKKEQL